MKSFLLTTIVFLSLSAHSQYYYNDIIGTQETNRQMKAYRDNKVVTMSAAGSDPRGVKASDFSEYHEVRENGKALKSSSIINLNKTVIYSRFDDQGRVISMTDSSTAIESVTTYTYDGAGKITLVQNTIRDRDNNFNQVETHQWLYDVNGKPSKMWRLIKSSENNYTDSLEIRFVNDEKGNTGEERTYRKGSETGYLYYYYDDNNRLTDIVRFNYKANRLLPDYLFEYDDNDRVIQKITTTSGNNLGYLTWRYLFDEKGLKTKEALFNKDKQLQGRIDFSYN